VAIWAAKNVVRSIERSARRQTRVRWILAAWDSQNVSSPEREVVRHAEDNDLLVAVSRLNPTDQELLRLRAWEELLLDEIANLICMATRSVESRLARVRERLARSLGSSYQNTVIRPPGATVERGTP
jgi:RNA polymerase sigma factor (sigma-70 family)